MIPAAILHRALTCSFSCPFERPVRLTFPLRAFLCSQVAIARSHRDLLLKPFAALGWHVDVYAATYPCPGRGRQSRLRAVLDVYN